MKRITRPTLLTRLHDPTSRIVALVAPRGYGKTFLLEEATAQGGMYVSVADAGGDALNIVAQIAAHLPQGVGSSLAYTHTHGPLTPLNAAAALRHDLSQHPTTLALDDLHTLDEQARVFLMDHFLPRLPTGVRVLLGMRTDHHLRLSALGLRVKLTTLTHTDLAFTPAEGEALGLTPSQYDQTQGWPELSLFVQRGGHPAEYVLAHTSTLSAELTAALYRAALLPIWRRHDPVQTTLGLPEGWLDIIREYVPCLEVSRGEYVPHTLYREILLDELRARPSEYRAAKHAMGQALARTQPLVALDAYLDAHAYEDACTLVQTLTQPGGRYRQRAQIAALLPMLERLATRLTPDLHIIYGLALYEHGRTADGLRHVEQALLDGAAPAPAALTLAELRLRNGNLTLARTYYQQALHHQPHLQDALTVRAHLAFGQAVHAQMGLATSLTEIEADAEQVVRAGSDASPTATLLALTALTLALAVRGNRTAAQVHLRAVRDLPAEHLEPDEYSRASAVLAQYAADDGDLTTAHSLLAQATHVLPSHTLHHHLHISLTRAWIHLRTVDAAQLRAALFNARAARSAAQDPPQRLEALVLNGICLVLLHHHQPDRAALHATELDGLLTELATVAAPYPAYQDTPVALRDLARATPDRPLGALRLGMAVPPQVQVLVALLIAARGDHLARAELDNLQDRWGQGTVRAYANWLNVTLPSSRPVLQAELLTTTPHITVNGQTLRLTGAAFQLMIALIFAGRGGVTRAHIPEMFGRSNDDSGVNLLYVTAKRLKTVLHSCTGLEEPLGTERGRYSLGQYLIQTDVDRLYITPARQLPTVYRTPLLSHSDNSELITTQREVCRDMVRRRIADLYHTHPHQATELAQTLSQHDPELMYSPLLQTMFPSVHVHREPPEHSPSVP